MYILDDVQAIGLRITTTYEVSTISTVPKPVIAILLKTALSINGDWLCSIVIFLTRRGSKAPIDFKPGTPIKIKYG